MLKKRAEGFIKRIEDSKITVPAFLLLLSAIIFTRGFIEDRVTFPFPHRFISPVFLHQVLTFFFSSFLSSTLMVSVLSKQPVEKVSKVILAAYVIIILPPIIDFFTSKIVFYDYIHDPNFPISTPNWSYLLRAFLTFSFGIRGVMIGHKIEVLLLMGLSAVYVFHKTRSKLRTILTPFIVYTVTFLYASFTNYVSFTELYPTFNAAHNLLYYSSIFTIFISIQSVIWLFLYKRKKFLRILKNLGMERSLHYIAMGGLGAFMAGHGWYTILLTLLCTLFGWQMASAINNLQQKGLDEASRNELKTLAIYCGLLSLLFATILSYAAIIVTLFCIAVSALYSLPPLRLRKIPFLSTFLIATGGLLSFTLGFYSETPQRFFPNDLALAILICFTLAFNTKDLKDYEGDKEDRIWTIPVLFGLKRGRIIIATLDLIAYIVVPIILGIPNFLIPSIIFAILTFLVVLRKECKEWQVFTLYFLYMALLLIMK